MTQNSPNTGFRLNDDLCLKKIYDKNDKNDKK